MDILSLLSQLNSSLPPDAWRGAHHAPPPSVTRLRPSSSSAVSLLQPTAPLAPSLCCKCQQPQDTLSPYHCCPCEPNSCPCDPFGDGSNLACQRSLKANGCYSVDGPRLCVCPQWQAAAADSFSAIANAILLGPGFAERDRSGTTWPVVKQLTASEGCATACLDTEGCTSYLSTLPPRGSISILLHGLDPSTGRPDRL